MGEQAQIEQFKKIKTELTRFLMMYKFALDEIETKVEILKEEFQSLHDYSPIEHTKSRLKSPESIMKKIYRKNSGLSLHDIKKNIKDIAGLRITCSFISDIYRVKSMLENQDDLTILEIKDYIRYPKPNGYKSLHMLVEVPVFMSDRQERVCVEIQIRTIAMDFWASLEHKIFYKYNQSVPEHLLQELKDAADAADELDRKMERLHTDIKEIKENNALQMEDEFGSILVNNRQFRLPAAFLDLIGEGERGIK
ncbi:GTP pyrophosphokinase family protein [Paenibacillus enshidis]|uniref:GTP pyrophosphokinase family protein n=1 Tax=Paenibacillus enshidis TaxID=1458439 RepID=A0ABV5ATY1_9BACL